MAEILAEAQRHGDEIDTDVVVLIDPESAPSQSRRRRITATSARDTAVSEGPKQLLYLDLDQLMDFWAHADRKSSKEDSGADISFAAVLDSAGPEILAPWDSHALGQQQNSRVVNALEKRRFETPKFRGGSMENLTVRRCG